MNGEETKRPQWWALGGGLTAGYVVALLLLTGIGGAAGGVYYRLIESGNRVERTYQVLRAADGVLSSLRDAETGQRGYLLTMQDAYLQPFRAAVSRMDEQIKLLQALVAEDPTQGERAGQLSKLATRKTQELDRTIRLAADGKTDEALLLVRSGEGKATMDAARQVCEELRENASRVQAENRRIRGQLRWITGAMLGAVVALGIGVVGSALFANAQLREQRDALQREIAARTVAQIHLHESREHYRTTLASIGDAVIATDVNGQIRFMNGVAETLTGWAFADAEMRPIREVFRIVNEETRKEVENPVDRVLREGNVVGLANHTVLIARDGVERPIDDSGAPIRSASDDIVGAVLVFRDISDRKHYEDERQQLLEREQDARVELERAASVKDEFLANLSHELRTPLNAVLGWTHILKRGVVSDEDRVRALDSIERNARMQAQLIADLLEVSAIASGQLRIEPQPLDFAALVQAIVDSSAPTLQAKSLRLKKLIDPTVLRVLADQTRIQQIVGNLLSNAIKFTPAGGLVTVSVRRDGTTAELIVSDTGQGISAAFLPHVFDRFRQEDSSLRRRYGGLGLGLTIVRQLVEAHGGSVRADSPGEGRGATIIVNLPLCGAEEVAPERPSADPGRIGAELRNLRVLVVDDDSDGRELLSRILSDAGCVVAVAGSGLDAIELMGRSRPELVISDISMPEMDGYELLARIRRSEASQPARVAAIALTGFAQAEVGEQAALVGFAAHVAKPIDPDDFLAVVVDVMARHRRSGSPPGA